MKTDDMRRELIRLVAEAPKIAPSIANYEHTRSYGSVTDEALDVQASQRWELEATALISALASSGIDVYIRLQAQYDRIKEDSKKFHSRSIQIHQVMQLLTSANELLGSAVGKIASLPAKRTSSGTLEVPPKVTLSWLFKHVPVGLWMAAAALLLAAFVAGVKSSEISLIREIFGLQKTPSMSGSDVQTKPAKP